MRRRSPSPAGVPVLGMLALILLTGCAAARDGSPPGPASGGGQQAASGTGRPCGRSRSAAGVTLLIKVHHGSVSCPTALSVERDYASAVASGKAPGNGGGGPVTVGGWICQGFNTPEVLSTGQASKCTKGSDEILAVLPVPAASTTAP